MNDIMRSLNCFQQVYQRVFTKKTHSDFIFSSYCALCGDLCASSKEVICRPCHSDLPLLNNPCLICSLPLPSTIIGRTCGKCLKNRPFYQASIIPLEYTFPNTIFIKQLKYKQKLVYSDLLAKSLQKVIQQKKRPLPDCIIPVPLHPLRLIKRGYNQSELIAKSLAKNLDISIDLKSCRRIKNTAQQTGFSEKERMYNVSNAFSISSIPYKHVAILDDVVTTGSTVNELARVLSLAGVKTIEVWACARTTLDPKDS